jgi:aspartyl-tRNA(Asn)/glutamyl-tRNA(Gln) amidotransferase subunit C
MPARLRLDAREIERFTRELNAILAHVEALEEVDIDGVDGVGGVTDEVPPPREDGGRPDELHSPPEHFAPAWRDGFFTLPRLAALGGDDGSP